MILPRLIIKLRVLLTLTLILGIGALFGGVYYLNEVGLNESTRKRISKELEKYGVYLEFDTLHYSLQDGLTAKNVTVYRSALHQTSIAKLPSLVINVDKTKLMRGKLKINTIELANADLDVPFIPDDDQSPRMSIKQVSGLINLPGESEIQTNELTGLFEGLRITVTCNLWGGKPMKKKAPNIKRQRINAQRYQAFLDRLKQWHWSADSPPDIHLYLNGDVSTPSQLKCKFTFNANDLTFNDFNMQSISFNGDYHDQLITIDQFDLTHEGQSIKGIADYDLVQKNGRYKLSSSLHPKRFARKAFNKKILKSLTMAGNTEIDVQGSFALPSPTQPKLDLKMTGHAASHDFSYNGIAIRQINSDFSWNNGNLYLNNLHLVHPAGEVDGRVIILDDIIRYDATANLPAHEYLPLIKGEIVQNIIKSSGFSKNSDIELHTKGSINRHDLTDWQSSGSAVVTDCSYNGVPLQKIQGEYELNRHSGSFTNIQVAFDYSKYRLHTKYGGASTGSLKADKVSFDTSQATVNIENLRGTAWPAPVLRMFHEKTAKHLEDYQFYNPPQIAANGQIGIKDDSPPTDFVCNFSTSGSTRYKFLKKNVTLKNVKGKVTVTSDNVMVDDLSATVFSGPMSGFIHVALDDANTYKGRFQWEQLNLKDIGKTYEINKADQGLLTGAFTFSGAGDNVSTLNGHGNIALSQANLFSIPVFGPLSILVDGLLSPVTHKKLLHEQASNASCIFSVTNGVIMTKDLTSTTSTMIFTGEGWIDLKRELIDLTIRMNFRGVLGLAEVPMKVIELPFRALRTVFTGKQVKGLRQFHGTGKLSEPTWRYTPFQLPRDGKNDPIFRRPPRAQIIE